MDREAVLVWLKEHPAAVNADPTQLMERLEQAVRRHAEQHAWRAAKAHVDDRMHEWEQQWGYHSSEAYAAKEVCPELARELKRMEPHFEKGDEPQLAGDELIGTLDPDARILVGDWIREVANDVEHRIWQQVVQYTNDRGRGLVREGRVSGDTNWDRTTAFHQQAARVAKILVDELEAHAPPEA